MKTTRMPLVSALLTAYPTSNDQSSTFAQVDVVGNGKAGHDSSERPRATPPKFLKQVSVQSSAQGVDQPRIVRLPELSARLGLSVSSIYVLISRKALVKPFALVPGGRAVGWLESDVVEFVLNRKDASTKEAV